MWSIHKSASKTIEEHGRWILVLNGWSSNSIEHSHTNTTQTKSHELENKWETMKSWINRDKHTYFSDWRTLDELCHKRNRAKSATMTIDEDGQRVAIHRCNSQMQLTDATHRCNSKMQLIDAAHRCSSQMQFTNATLQCDSQLHQSVSVQHSAG